MAALDFGMALARGMLPTSEKAQKDLLNLAGGRNIFKSEDWWQQQVDKQISKGYRETTSNQTQYLLPSGEYTVGDAVTNTTYGRTGIGGTFYSVPSWQVSYNPIFGYGGGIQARTSTSYVAPKNVVMKNGQMVTREVPIFGERKDFTAGELSDIERSAERGAKRVKAESEASKASQRRLRRGTGGLVGKAMATGAKPATGLPELGTTGLGMTAGLFGADIKL